MITNFSYSNFLRISSESEKGFMRFGFQSDIINEKKNSSFILIQEISADHQCTKVGTPTKICYFWGCLFFATHNNSNLMLNIKCGMMLILKLRKQLDSYY